MSIGLSDTKTHSEKTERRKNLRLELTILQKSSKEDPLPAQPLPVLATFSLIQDASLVDCYTSPRPTLQTIHFRFIRDAEWWWVPGRTVRAITRTVTRRDEVTVEDREVRGDFQIEVPKEKESLGAMTEKNTGLKGHVQVTEPRMVTIRTTVSTFVLNTMTLRKMAAVENSQNFLLLDNDVAIFYYFMAHFFPQKEREKLRRKVANKIGLANTQESEGRGKEEEEEENKSVDEEEGGERRREKLIDFIKPRGKNLIKNRSTAAKDVSYSKRAEVTTLAKFSYRSSEEKISGEKEERNNLVKSGSESRMDRMDVGEEAVSEMENDDQHDHGRTHNETVRRIKRLSHSESTSDISLAGLEKYFEVDTQPETGTTGTDEPQTPAALCRPSPLSPPPSAPPLPPKTKPLRSRCSMEYAKTPGDLVLNTNIKRTGKDTIDKIRRGEDVNLRGWCGKIRKVTEGEGEVEVDVTELNEIGEKRDELLGEDEEQFMWGLVEGEMADPDDNDPLEQGDKIPEFPGLKAEDILSSTIKLIQSRGGQSEGGEEKDKRDKTKRGSETSILRGAITKSKDLLNSVQEVNARIEEGNTDDLPQARPDSTLDTSINHGLTRLRSFRERRIEEEKARIKEQLRQRKLNGPTTRSQAEEAGRLKQDEERFDPYQHPGDGTDESLGRTRMGKGNSSEGREIQEAPEDDRVELFVVESDISFSNPETASTPAMSLGPNGRRGDKVSSWADDSNTSAFSSILDAEGKRKRKRNKRSRRCKRRTEADTSTNSEVRGAHDHTLYNRTVRNLENSTERLEEERTHLKTIAKVVEGANAAERAAVSAGLTPIKMTVKDLLNDSQLKTLNPDFPPPYESVFGGKGNDPKECVFEKDFHLKQVLQTYMALGDQEVQGAEKDKEHEEAAGPRSEPEVLKKISKLLNSDKGLNGTFGALNPDDSGVVEVPSSAFEFQRDATNQGVGDDDMDASRDVHLSDLMPKRYKRDPDANKVVRAKAIVQFVLVKRERGTEVDQDWEFASKEEMDDMVAEMENENAKKRNGLSKALEYNNMWGQVPILGLRVRDLLLLDRFRDEIDNFICPINEFTTFPKLGLERKFATTIMLWQNMRKVEIDTLPRSLLDRNPELKGGLKVSRCKTFKDSDKDVRGDSMEGVRLIQIETTKEFRDSLYYYPRSYKFGLGPGRVVIRGGERMEESNPLSRGFRGRRGGRGARAGHQNQGNRRDQAAKNLSENSVKSFLDQNGDTSIDEAASRNMSSNTSRSEKNRRGEEEKHKNIGSAGRGGGRGRGRGDAGHRGH